MEKKYQKCFSFRWMEQRRKCSNCPVDLWDLCREETTRRKRSNGKQFRPKILPRLKIEIDKKKCFRRYYSYKNWEEHYERQCDDCQDLFECHRTSPVPKKRKKRNAPYGYRKGSDGTIHKIPTLFD